MPGIVRSNPQPVTQADVPSDVWLEIIVHLEAPDVLSLQSTCKLLYDALYKKSVWISVLQRGCSRDGVYFPSYPVNEMDVRRLQRAALGPYRLYKLVESCSAHSSNPPPLAHASNTLLTTPIVQSAVTQATFLVPGGRYLIVGDVASLSAWDLGPPDCSASPEPLLVARIAIPSHHVLQNYGRPLLSVRARADDTLQVALAVGGALLSVYHINPSQPSPSFQCIATLPVDSTSYPGVDWACRALSSSDDVVLLGLGTACGSFVWNFREGWYGFGPRRGLLFWVENYAITSKSVVIEFGGGRAWIWSADAQRLRTRPVTPGETVLLSDSDAITPPSFSPIHMPEHARHLSNPHDMQVTRTTIHPNILQDDNDGDSVLCDMLYDDNTLSAGATKHRERPIRGYRYRIRPIQRPGQGEGYTAEFCLEARFDLPPNENLYYPEEGYYLAGRRGSGSPYGSTLFLDGTGSVDRGLSQRYSLLLYSLPNRWADTPSSSTTAGCVAEGSVENAHLADDVAVPAGLTCVWTGMGGMSRRMCMASGRFFVIEGLGPDSSCCVYEFLSPWNYAECV